MSDLRRTDLTDTGPATGHRPAAYAPDADEFDSEINIRAVVWSGVGLTITVLVVVVLMWWMLKGIGSFEDRRDTPLTPVEAAHPQPPPPSPRLQWDVVTDMNAFLASEKALEEHAGWADPNRSALRLPIDAAIDVIARRGVAPLATAPAGDSADTAGTPQGSVQPGGQQPAATMQNALPGAPAQPAPTPAAANGNGQGPGR